MREARRGFCWYFTMSLSAVFGQWQSRPIRPVRSFGASVSWVPNELPGVDSGSRGRPTASQGSSGRVALALKDGSVVNTLEKAALLLTLAPKNSSPRKTSRLLCGVVKNPVLYAFKNAFPTANRK